MPADRLASFAAAPCTLLTDEQRTGLDENHFTVRAGQVKADAKVPTCEYGDLDHRETGTLRVTTAVVRDAGLAQLTQDHLDGFSPDYWKPDTMGGHQVVDYADHGSPEFCDVAIGITDTSYVAVEVIKFDSGSPRTNACRSTSAVAGQVLVTIMGAR